MFEVVDLEEDFEVFNRPYPTESPGTTSRPSTSAQISSNQVPTNIPEAMVLQHKKNTSLLKLLESNVGGSTLKVVVQPQPPTPLPTHTSPSEQPEKKRKIEKKGKEVFEECEIAFKDLEHQKGAKIGKGA